MRGTILAPGDSSSKLKVTFHASTAFQKIMADSSGGSESLKHEDLIIHGPAHRGANGAAMPTDEDDQDGHFFFNHPEREG